jgi:hypothetical protein
MPRWPRGEAEIERLLGLGHLQTITGAAADGAPLLAKAGRTLATAASITSSDPDSRHGCFGCGRGERGGSPSPRHPAGRREAASEPRLLRLTRSRRETLKTTVALTSCLVRATIRTCPREDLNLHALYGH